MINQVSAVWRLVKKLQLEFKIKKGTYCMNDAVVGARTYAINICLPMQIKRIITNKTTFLPDERINHRSNDNTL